VGLSPFPTICIPRRVTELDYHLPLTKWLGWQLAEGRRRPLWNTLKAYVFFQEGCKYRQRRCRAAEMTCNERIGKIVPKVGAGDCITPLSLA